MSSAGKPTLGQGSSRCPLPEDLAKVLLASSAKAAGTSFQVDLHPVVLLHIADHNHRNVAQHGGRSRIFGALLGRQDGPKAEICFAFEILVKKENNRYLLDKEYWLLKEAQFKQVLPGLDYIGWYTVSNEYLSMDDLDLQNQFWEISQNLFLLKVRANKPESFPADLFESVIEFDGANKSSVKFIPISYNIVFEQAEQIGVHHIATKADTENTGGSATAETEYQISMRSMSSAVSMLQERLTVISHYMQAVDAGTLPPDDNILTELKRITELLSSLDSEEQDEKYNIMKLQAVMTSSVGTYTQTVENLLDFIRKNAVMIDKRGPGKGMRGSMFGNRGWRGPKHGGRAMTSRLRSSDFRSGIVGAVFGRSSRDRDENADGRSGGESSQ